MRQRSNHRLPPPQKLPPSGYDDLPGARAAGFTNLLVTKDDGVIVLNPRGANLLRAAANSSRRDLAAQYPSSGWVSWYPRSMADRD
jgi:hypothetical protein